MSTLNEFLEKIPTERHSLVRELDTVISNAAPKLSTSLKWGNLTYHGEKNVCALVAHKQHIYLQFWSGSQLKDSRGLLNGTGKDMRHIKIASESDIDAKYITDLIKQAMKLGGS